MGVDIPAAGVESILKAQSDWERNSISRCTKTKLQKRNMQKKTKRERHEREKEFMGALQGLGSAVGEYSGGGQGELESDNVAKAVAADDVEDYVDVESRFAEEGSFSDDLHPLMFFYDCETTGLSIYNDHIIELAAEIAGCTMPPFTSLVKTSRRIPPKGIQTTINQGLII